MTTGGERGGQGGGDGGERMEGGGRLRIGVWCAVWCAVWSAWSVWGVWSVWSVECVGAHPTFSPMTPLNSSALSSSLLVAAAGRPSPLPAPPVVLPPCTSAMIAALSTPGHSTHHLVFVSPSPAVSPPPFSPTNVGWDATTKHNHTNREDPCMRSNTHTTWRWPEQASRACVDSLRVRASAENQA